MQRILSHKRLKAVGAVIAMVGATLAFAAWTSDGPGNGYAKATDPEPLTTLDAKASTEATLYPGADGDVTLKISNPNPYAVKVTAISQRVALTGNAKVPITVDTVHSLCLPGNVSFTDQSSLTESVPAAADGSDGTKVVTLTDAASMSTDAPDACQGATFTIPLKMTGTQG